MFKKWFGFKNDAEESTEKEVDNIETEAAGDDSSVNDEINTEAADFSEDQSSANDEMSVQGTDDEEVCINGEENGENSRLCINDGDGKKCEEEENQQEPIQDEGDIGDSCENQEAAVEKIEKKSLFVRLKEGLSKAKSQITDAIDDVLGTYTKIDDDMLEEIEEILITADIGVSSTMEIIDELKERIKRKSITDPSVVKDILKEIISEILDEGDTSLNVEPSPAIIVVVGVNGVGKTTTIGKLAAKYKSQGKRVMLAAGDTFRAAAAEQLTVWAQRAGCEIIKHTEGADPGAVIFDACKAASARGVDLLICDTAGRLHNKANLMKELSKIFKIIDRELPNATRETLLVVDATTGQNAVVQVKTFKEAADITGIALTKLDGTAKGGVVIAVKKEVDVPVKLIGVGEGIDDLQEFDSQSFVRALFGE